MSSSLGEYNVQLGVSGLGEVESSLKRVEALLSRQAKLEERESKRRRREAALAAQRHEEMMRANEEREARRREEQRLRDEEKALRDKAKAEEKAREQRRREREKELKQKQKEREKELKQKQKELEQEEKMRRQQRREMLLGAGAMLASGAVGAAGSMYLLSQNERAGDSLRAMGEQTGMLGEALQTVGLEVFEIVSRFFDLPEAIRTARDWLLEFWDDWKGTFLAGLDLLSAVYSGFRSFFSWLGEIVGPVFQAIGTAFSVLGEQILGESKTVALSFGETWGESFRTVLELTIFFMREWQSMLGLAGSHVAHLWDDIVQGATAIMTNIVVVGQWVALAIYDAFNFLWQAIRNIGLNIRNFMESVQRWVSGGGWSFDAVELDRGFRSSLMRDAWSFVHPEYDDRRLLDDRYDTLGRRLADFMQEREERRDTMLANLSRPAMPEVGELDQNIQFNQPRQQFGFVGFSELARRSQEETLQRLAERQAGAAERAAVGIEALAEAARGPGLRVQGTGARYE